MNAPRFSVQVSSATTARIDIDGWMQQYVSALLSVEGINSVSTSYGKAG